MADLTTRDNISHTVLTATERARWTSRVSAQPVTLGVDSGFTHVGLSAVSPARELLSADVQLRTDMAEMEAAANAR